jgi:hypothetical protein
MGGPLCRFKRLQEQDINVGWGEDRDLSRSGSRDAREMMIIIFVNNKLTEHNQ